MDTLRLYVSIPVAGFRVAQAREFWETYPLPPPSTVYGMLLSLVGEPNRLLHRGAEIATALLSKPERSVVLRTLWRVKNIGKIPGYGEKRYGPGQNPEDFKVKDSRGGNRRPDFQELLTDIQLSVWVRKGRDENEPALIERLDRALSKPETVVRFGGLSLGESTHLVDEVRTWHSGDPDQGRLLVSDVKGDLSLPVWPDHVGSKNTVWGQFELLEKDALVDEPQESAWVEVGY